MTHRTDTRSEFCGAGSMLRAKPTPPRSLTIICPHAADLLRRNRVVPGWWVEKVLDKGQERLSLCTLRNEMRDQAG